MRAAAVRTFSSGFPPASSPAAAIAPGGTPPKKPKLSWPATHISDSAPRLSATRSAPPRQLKTPVAGANPKPPMTPPPPPHTALSPPPLLSSSQPARETLSRCSVFCAVCGRSCCRAQLTSPSAAAIASAMRRPMPLAAIAAAAGMAVLDAHSAPWSGAEDVAPHIDEQTARLSERAPDGGRNRIGGDRGAAADQEDRAPRIRRRACAEGRGTAVCARRRIEAPRPARPLLSFPTDASRPTSHAFVCPMAQTSFHSASFTGTTDRRPWRTSLIGQLLLGLDLGERNRPLERHHRGHIHHAEAPGLVRGIGVVLLWATSQTPTTEGPSPE